jgi:hypothetical protein
MYALQYPLSFVLISGLQQFFTATGVGDKPAQKDDNDEALILIAELKVLSMAGGIEGSLSKVR